MKIGRCAVATTAAILCSGPALASSAQIDPLDTQSASDDSALVDIVVTARRRSEKAQDTPLSLTVATGADLERRSVRTLTDIQLTTPSLKLTPNALSPSSTVLSGRGLAVVDARLTTDPAFGIYVDGVYLPRTLGTDASELIDIARIEILNGPQGTLYGKNSTGGALNIFTNTPTHAVEGLVKLRAGSYGDVSAGAVLNLPIAPTLAVRGVIQSTYRDGYGTNAFDGRAFGRFDAFSSRLSALWQPTESVSLLLRGDYSDTSSSGNSRKGLALLSPTALVTAEVARETGLSSADAARLYQSYSNGDYDDGSLNVHPFEKIRLYGYSATLEWALADALSLKSISALRYIRRSGAIDLDGSPFQVFESPVLSTRDRQFSQEVQLQGTLLNDGLKYIVGGYYADEKGTELNLQRALGFLSIAAGPTRYSTGAQNKTAAAFAQVTYKVTDALSVTGGVRYTKDKRSLSAANRTNINCLSLGVTLASLAGAPCVANTSVKFHAVSYTGSVEYKLRSDILAYGRVDHGYRTGGLPQNGGSAISASAAALSFSPFRPEFAQSYEAGLKSEFLDRHARLNVAVYSVTYSDLQRGTTVPVPGTTSVITVVANAAKARVRGVEADATVIPFRGLELSGTFGYTRPRYLVYSSNGVDRTGEPFLFVPKFTYSASAAYTSDVSFGSVRGQVDYSRSDGTFVTIPSGYQRHTESINARLTLTVAEQGLDVSLFGRNLTNYRQSLYPLSAFVTLGAVWNGPSNQPRTMGIEVTKRF